MKITELDQTMSTRQPFAHRAVLRVPVDPGCYVMASIDDDVLYIGRTVSLRRRIGEHLENAEMTTRTSLGWPRWFYYKTMAADAVEHYERRLLGRHEQYDGSLPPLNRAGP